MITALSIVVPEKGRGIKRLFNSLRSDKINVELKRARGVCIKHITYLNRRGKPDIGKIDKLVGAQRNHLLCDENISFPENSGYKRFYSSAFSARLCTNMALYAVSKCKNPENLTIGVYDPSGSLHGFLLGILRFCCDVYVVTDNPQSYCHELDEAMNELGAAAVVTKQRDELRRCDLIAAPSQICEKLPLREDAVVLTGAAPKENIKGLVYSKYYFKMPNGFDRIKPAELEEDYFCSALYSLGSQYELGSIIPAICRGGTSSQTVQSLCAYLERFA